MKKEMDVLKSLGISTSPRSLVQSEQTQIQQIGVRTEAQQIRKGMGVSARDMLDAQLNKGFALAMPQMERMSPHATEVEQDDWKKKDEDRKVKADEKYRKESRKKNSYEGTLKNTHGEEFHSDNDKQVEDMVSGAEEIDREFDAKAKRPSTSRRPYDFNPDDPSDEKRYAFKSKSKKSTLTREELFLKGLEAEGESFVVEKSFKAPSAKPSKKAPHQAKDPLQAKQERAERRAAMGKGELVDWAKEEEKEHKISKKSELDEVVDLVKGKFKEAKIDADVLANVHENSPGIVEEKNKKPAQKDFKIKSNNKFIKSIGQGGIVFDFGPTTGNPIADNATKLLNQFADPIQASNAQYQQDSYQKAIEDYTQKGDQAFAKDTTPFGNLEKGWGDQLNKPLDQQVKEAYEKGMFEEKAPNNPKFEKSVASVGGQKVQAQSETDAAVLEMFKAEQAAMNSGGGFVADASTGGKINVIAGLPLENQIPEHMVDKK